MSRIESLALSLFPAPAAPVAVERGTDSGFGALLRENETAVTRRAPTGQASSETAPSRPQAHEEKATPAAAFAGQDSAKPAAETASATTTGAESANDGRTESAPSGTAAEATVGEQSGQPVPDMPPAALAAVLPVPPLPQQPALPEPAPERYPDGSTLPADLHLLSALPDAQAPLTPVIPAPAVSRPTDKADLYSALPGIPAAISPETLTPSESPLQTQSRDSVALPALPPTPAVQNKPTPRPDARQARPAAATSPAGNIPAQAVTTTAPPPTGDIGSDTPLRITGTPGGEDAATATEDPVPITADARSAPEGSAALPAAQPLPAPEPAGAPQQALAGGLNPAAVPLTTSETPTQESESAPTSPGAPPTARERGKPAAADAAKPQAAAPPPDTATGAAKPASPSLSGAPAAPAADAPTVQPGFDHLLQQMQPPTLPQNTPHTGLASGRPEGSPTGFHGLPLATPVTEQISLQVRKALDDGNNRIRIKMQPAALGQVEVRMEVGHDGSLKAVIAADRHETFEWLQRDARSLERALQENGFKTDTGSLSFQYRGGEGGGQQRSFAEQQQRLWDTDSTGRRRLDATVSITTETPTRQSIVSRRLDLNV